jgi:hypothetical protein
MQYRIFLDVSLAVSVLVSFLTLLLLAKDFKHHPLHMKFLAAWMFLFFFN